MARTPYDPLKRALDICGAGLGLLLLWPVMLVVALAVGLSMGRPVVFRQQRSGVGGRPFTIVKFRTMHPGAGPDVERTTRLGAWLRMTSLDELPELVNVLRGDMSLVGPRPLLWEYLTVLSPEEAGRHRVRPGLTGWAQVHGCDDTRWDERLRLDLYYVRRCSLLLDLQIMLRTLGAVVRRARRRPQVEGGTPLRPAPISAGPRDEGSCLQPVPDRR